jgi:hypothetical protein
MIINIDSELRETKIIDKFNKEGGSRNEED